MPKTKEFFLDDTAVAFGHAAFTTLRVADGQIECFDAHMDRLKKTCTLLDIPQPVVDIEQLFRLLEKNRALAGVWRMKITVMPKKSGVTSTVYGQLSPYIRQKKPLRVCFFSYTPSSLTGTIKHLGFLDHFLLRKSAKKHGFDDCILHTEDNILLEASFANIIWEKGGEFFTPDLELPILPGVMLENIRCVLEEQGIAFHTVRATPAVLEQARVYITNSLIWLQPVQLIDDCVLLRNITQERMLFQKLEQRIAQQAVHYTLV